MESRVTLLSRHVREMLLEQVEYRELLWQMTVRDLLLRYKQTIMGFGWAIFTPVVNTVIFTVIFTRVAPIATEVPYALYAYCGLLPWTFFASSLRFAASSLTGNTALVTKVYFPRENLAFSAVLVSFVDFLVASTVLIGMMFYFQLGISTSVLFLPILLLIQITFTAGLALILAMANLYFRDIKYIFELVLTFWMFATPVLYPVELVGGRLGELLRFNPMTPIIDGYRAVLLRGDLPAAAPLLWTTLIAVATLAIGWMVFHQKEFQFAENV
jgi:lipopolysaccharide transport system permease protein